MTDALEHLNEREKAALGDYLHRLRTAYGSRVMHVFLFGSKVRGDASEESDIDLLVVVDSDDWRFQKELGWVGTQIDLEYDVVLSDIIVGSERYAMMQRYGEPLYRSVEREGIDIWTTRPEPLSASALKDVKKT